MTKKSKIVIKKWGTDLVIKCFYQNYIVGNGARSIGLELGITTRQADSLINAGYELGLENKVNL
jgi:hypothetical protein